MAGAAGGLGADGTVEAELYKLLVYEPGGFFLEHRDTEKVGGMFATLIVVLPSEHEGGELVVAHQDREAILGLEPQDFGRARWAAFSAQVLRLPDSGAPPPRAAEPWSTRR